MDVTQVFHAAASRGGTCADPVFASVPELARIAATLDTSKLYAAGVDVLGAACGAARIMSVERCRVLLAGKPAWGVARVHSKHTLCVWDGRTVWAQGRKGATKLRPDMVLISWML